MPENEKLTPDIPVDDEDVDVEAIMQQIRAYIMARKMAADERLPATAGRFDGRLAPDLYEALYQATMTYDQVAVPEAIAKPSLPVVGALWTAVRHQFHQLVRFYVNQVAARQMIFNRHLVTLAGEMVRELESLPTAVQLREMRDEFRRLEEELDRLKVDQDK
jgi:hypothetical protein